MAFPFGLRVQIARNLTVYGKRFRAGSKHEVAIAEGLGSRDYDAHAELPVAGWGVPLDAVLVDGQPYVEWARANDVRCPRCQSRVVDFEICPALPSPGPSCDLTPEGDPVRRSRR